MQQCSHVIIGAGHTGIFLAKQLADLGHEVLLIEHLGVGGAAVHSTIFPTHLVKQKSSDFFHNLKFFKNNKNKERYLLNYRQEIFNTINHLIIKRQYDLKSELDAYRNIALLMGRAEFISKDVLKIVDHYSGKEELLKFKTVYIATGKNCLAGLKIKGVENSPVCHKWNYWKFKQVPKSISLLGLNQETLEVADIYSNFGIKVDIFESKPSYECLKIMDLTATNYVLKKLMRKQVDFHFSTPISRILHLNEVFNIYLDNDYKFTTDHLYVSSKEVFNGEYLGLKNTGITYSSNGISTNFKGKTTASNIYAFGSATREENNKYKPLENFLHFAKISRKHKPSKSLQLFSNSLALIKAEAKLLYEDQRSDSEVSIKAAGGALTIGMSEALVRYKSRIKPKTIYFSHANKEGFIKVVYNSKNNEVVGFSTAGEIGVMYNTFLKYSYKKKLKLSEIKNFLQFDLHKV